MSNFTQSMLIRGLSSEVLENIFKGAIFDLSPAYLTLSIIVVTQNMIILKKYYNYRTKFAPRLFMGIALADVVRAQGAMVLALISILVFVGHLDTGHLYHGLIYHSITASPGNSCSKLINMLLTFSFTKQVRDPFRRIPTDRWMKILSCLCVIITLLHFGDGIVAIFLSKNLCKDTKTAICGSLFLVLMTSLNFPGLDMAWYLSCFSYLDLNLTSTEISLTHSPKENCDIGIGFINIGITVFAVIYFLVPIFVVIVCMILQTKHIRKSFRESVTESSPLLPDPSRHVSVTVFLISVLFSFCHIAYVFVLLTIFLVNNKLHLNKYSDQNLTIRLGVLVGFTEFMLPLLYAAAYPIIVICRKQELRERYVGYLKRVAFCFRVSGTQWPLEN